MIYDLLESFKNVIILNSCILVSILRVNDISKWQITISFQDKKYICYCFYKIRFIWPSLWYDIPINVACIFLLYKWFQFLFIRAIKDMFPTVENFIMHSKVLEISNVNWKKVFFSDSNAWKSAKWHSPSLRNVEHN